MQSIAAEMEIGGSGLIRIVLASGWKLTPSCQGARWRKLIGTLDASLARRSVWRSVGNGRSWRDRAGWHMGWAYT